MRCLTRTRGAGLYAARLRTAILYPAMSIAALVSCRLGIAGLGTAVLVTAALGADAQAQSSAARWRIATLSQLGCPRDGVTDATACVNGFLSQASAVNPLKLILDGTVALRGLVISATGHTWIEGLGWDTGIVIEAKSNQDGIRIGAYTGGFSEGQGAVPPSRSAANIILSNFTLDATGDLNSTGNGLGVAADNTPLAGVPAHPIFGAILTNATGIVIDHVRFINPPQYCLTLANVSDVTVRDSSFASMRILQDGVHVDGPAENISILNNVFSTGDDAVALNAPEGYGGDITGVLVDGNTFRDALRAVRVYTSTGNPHDAHGAHDARRLIFTRNQGSTRRVAFNLGSAGAPALPKIDQIKDLSIADNDLSSPEGFLAVQTPFGSLRLLGNTYDAPSTNTAMVQVLQPGGGDVALADNTILRNGDGHAAAPLLTVAPGAALGRLTLAGNRVVDEQTVDRLGAPYPPVPFLLDVAGSLAALRIDSADTAGFTALVNPATQFQGIASVAGPGVLATAARIPDALTSDGTSYISASGANAGRACVKAGGVVKPL